MTGDSGETTLPSFTLPEWRPFPDPAWAERNLRAVPDHHGSSPPLAPRRSFAPKSAPRAPRPLASGGPPPTIIRSLDALFAADRARRAPPPPPAPAPVAEHVAEPIDPKELAQALLRKVERDFGSVPPPPPAPTLPPSYDAATDVALPDDDEDVARLTSWYTRALRALFGR